MPLIAQRGEEVPYVRVLADRTGAELDAVSAAGVPRHREAAGAETFPMRKVHAGGWSHRRYQQAAEESWKRNAGTGARLVLVEPGRAPLEHGIGAVLRYADGSSAAT